MVLRSPGVDTGVDKNRKSLELFFKHVLFLYMLYIVRCQVIFLYEVRKYHLLMKVVDEIISIKSFICIKVRKFQYKSYDYWEC